MKCPKCGYENSSSSSVCSSCYFDLKGATKPVSPPAVKNSTRVAPPPPVPVAPAASGQPDFGQPAAPGPVVPGVASQAPGADPTQGAFPGPSYTPAAPYMEYVGFWSRFAAYFVDGFLLMIASFVIMFAIGIDFAALAQAGAAGRGATPGMPGATPGLDPQMAQQVAELQSKVSLMQALSLAIQALYNIGLNTAKGATLGKMALGIKIVKLDGSPIGVGTAVGRFVLQIVLATVTCGLAYLAVAFNAKKQGLHDMIMGTVVIRSR